MVCPSDSWDYGDNDDAHVTPFYTNEKESLQQWQDWLLGKASPFSCWVRPPPAAREAEKDGAWACYPQTGYAAAQYGEWSARLDASPLGFGSIAAHGQLDALHLSVWHAGRALLIDPGTGCYFGKPKIREHFVSRQAHNGPHFTNDSLYPIRNGPFLWGGHHTVPRLSVSQETAVAAIALDEKHLLSRTVLCAMDGIEINDEISAPANTEVVIHWQFAPEVQIALFSNVCRCSLGSSRYEVTIESTSEISMQIIHHDGSSDEPAGLCSPYYNKIITSPVLKIHGHCAGNLRIQTFIRTQSQ
jgi:hypothetical protein